MKIHWSKTRYWLQGASWATSAVPQSSNSFGSCIPKGTAQVSLSLGPSSFLCSHTCWGPSTAQAEAPCLPSSASCSPHPTLGSGLGPSHLYRLSGSSSPRSAESLSPSHTPARKTQTLSPDFPWLPRGKAKGYKTSLTGWRGEASAVQVQLCCPAYSC